MNRKLEIKEQTYTYLGFLYRVQVTRERGVYWEVWKPGPTKFVFTYYGEIRAPRVKRNPYKAVKKAHKDARKWIDTWLNTHFALETAMNLFADDYCQSRTEFPKNVLGELTTPGEFNHGATA